MAKDEQLREALLELQTLREREAKSLKESQALLNSLEAYTNAANASDALYSVFQALQQEIGAACCLLLGQMGDGGFQVLACDDPAYVGRHIHPPLDPLRRARAIFDIAELDGFDGPLDLSPFQGLLVTPAGEGMAMLVFAKRPHSFKREDLGFTARLAGLAVQAYRNREIAEEKDLLAATIEGSSSGIAISDSRDPDQPLIYVNPE